MVHHLRHAISGPQGLAFMPAITLAAYWFGGEGLLLAAALGIPGLIAGASLLGRSRQDDSGYDRLTGLPLRERFERSIDNVIVASPTGGGATACLAIGIDDQARLSSRLGAEAAASVISGVTDRVMGAVRDSDLVARLDTDCLGVALSPARRTDLETLIRIAGRVQAALTEPFSVDGVKVFVSVSVGIAPPARLDRPTGARLVDAALTALAAAKVEASGAIRTYSETMTPPATTSGIDAATLSEALDAGAFEPWYQPIVNLKTQQIMGFEALARWHHAERGVLMPADFLDQIRKSGLSQRLTEVMLYDICTRQTVWDDAGLDIPRIWLNLGQDDLLNPKLPEKIDKQFKRFDVDGARYGFDISEKVLRASTDTLIGRNLRALSRLGCDIALDQFGASPVSILELRRFSVGTVKLDRAVTKAIDRNPDQAALFDTCLGVADRLKLNTIAVGIENTAEHVYARDAGCQGAQGMTLAAAMPSDAVMAWVRKHRDAAPVTDLAPKRTERRGIG